MPSRQVTCSWANVKGMERSVLQLVAVVSNMRGYTLGKNRSSVGTVKSVLELDTSASDMRGYTPKRDPSSASSVTSSFLRLDSWQLIKKKIHTGEKLFNWGSCEKCFTNGSIYKQYNIIHTGRKPSFPVQARIQILFSKWNPSWHGMWIVIMGRDLPSEDTVKVLYNW